jgi:hypothetical protein
MSHPLAFGVLTIATLLSAACTSSTAGVSAGEQNITSGASNMPPPIPASLDGKDLSLSLVCTPKIVGDGNGIPEQPSGPPSSFELVVRLSTAPSGPLEYIGKPDPASQGQFATYRPFFQIRTGLGEPSAGPELLGWAVVHAPSSLTLSELSWQSNGFGNPKLLLDAKLEIVPPIPQVHAEQLKLTYRFEDKTQSANPDPNAPLFNRILDCEGVAQP